MGGSRPVPGVAGTVASSMSRRAMGQPRRITDSFPRRRQQRGPGRPPGRLKEKDKDKAQVKAKVRDCPRAPSQRPPDPALLEMLRRFDLCWEYGPCTGITRLQRWERAQALGLSPPGPIRDALLEHRDNPDVTYSPNSGPRPQRLPWQAGSGDPRARRSAAQPRTAEPATRTCLVQSALGNRGASANGEPGGVQSG
ncbi:DNA polymerase delta subunit 4 isoform X3 [Myiozetetes cayanensis]|uniref:DNA polymerase delta subunit 4 isoform X3 n=1 Tax=Myiozetetes cayanensis TaxID=478635 RepID=UPI00215DF30E|nr:DNA polymerase delta subunit 4 isoform X3 [Myiozetetes cayanensis]XP_050192633.1 DNA polymerase delta subunit 4 isoform X3 [Myiozetetes cayanensis]XP_050192634.1 DNA polymerase delta subunit 4 isoform X3 [Myiozetetes cayanensis]XP_050192635.1 DNA polymerase delta subunit 4 isoform X3 [Myiozetetes cayanensis]XP_050192636.1 DNA polymerase delta subunit 4 isoform X3 [Myiozetetes cayanensis]XP_050192637.1 DNA polymerase delta subunit 4 isoform X3 [Myiozetetes cayanensis]XP_050192638.1 DNA poly